MGGLTEKVALVVGAASPGNIGQAIARRLATDGAKVVVAGRHEVPMAQLAIEIGGASELCDITREEDIARAVDRTIEKFGRLDIAVNATGKNHRKPFVETTRAELDEITAVQFIGPFLLMQAVIQGMKRCGRGGSIIQISSVTSTILLHDHALYMGTKAGIDHVVRSVAYDHGPDGIRVNSISPGPTIGAPMAAYVFNDPAAVEQLRLAFPLRRIGTTADVAEVAAWLASDACFLTGQLIQANGGLTLATPFG
jgi:NAD(P)-dependent dehydrogenase (short-subunit alcohol dehydrogenase family)